MYFIKKRYLILVTFLLSALIFAQQRPSNPDFASGVPKVKISGTVVEKESKQPLEYATVSFVNAKSGKVVAGGITNSKGEFNIELMPSIYTIKIEFISFKSLELKDNSLTENTNLGKLSLSEDSAQLKEVVVRAEKSTVEIKLDKKVYNVGQDMLVKGGTVSDVLENVPSVTVDVEGNVSLRGSDNVRIFIDGRPSNSLNMADALRQIPADAIDKVEVITNPSARYDAEGGAGILNIILKKGKVKGFNGALIASAGLPESYGLSANLNYKTKSLNFFTSTGYNYRTNEGGGLTNSQYFNTDGSTNKLINESRDTKRIRKGITTKTGTEWTINPTTFWTNAISYQNNRGDTQDLVTFDNFDANRTFIFNNYRLNSGFATGNNLEFTSNFIKNFNDKGHKLTVDGSYSKNEDVDSSIINGVNTTFPDQNTYNSTYNDAVQKQFQFQTDYVLPFGKGSQFEAGYKGNFNEINKAFDIFSNSTTSNIGNFSSNTFQYKEKINAIYSQYGFKIKKLSFLFGLRLEDTNIDVNLLATREFNNKKYTNLFPSALVNYEMSSASNLTFSYSKRLSRPRGRFLDPTPNVASNINIFSGNADLDPSLTDKFDLGLVRRWDKLTLNTSLYFEKTVDLFSFVRFDSGNFVNGTPVVFIRPINIGKEQKTGFEFTLNYTPIKKWKLNSSFNLFNSNISGNFNYINADNIVRTINLDNKAVSWFARLNSRLTLPHKIDWQLSYLYFGPMTTAQGRNLDQYGINMALSKDIFKEKATIAFNVSDLFNTRKSRTETNLSNLNSYNEFQFRKRQFNLSFTYRFNKKKTEKEKVPQRGNEEEGGSAGF